MIDVAKRYVIHLAGHNLGRIMFALFGVGTPRGLQGLSRASRDLLAAILVVWATICRILSSTIIKVGRAVRCAVDSGREIAGFARGHEITPSSTGC